MSTRLELMRAVAEEAAAHAAWTSTQAAIDHVQAIATFHQRTFHDRRIPDPLQEALNCLQLQLTSDEAYLSSCNFHTKCLKEKLERTHHE